MATKKLTNRLQQAVPLEYLTATGLRFRWLRSREVLNLDESRVGQSITDLVSQGHVTLVDTADSITSGFEAL